MTATGALPSAHSRRLHLEIVSRFDASSLAQDVKAGLTATSKHLPPKYFYDARGADLFDQICDTPEYYPTRVEAGLLRQIATEVVDATEPAALVELGSGSARKTRVLFDALQQRGRRAGYVPFDVTEQMLRDTAKGLLNEYPWLEIHGIVGDYEQDLGRLHDTRSSFPGRRLFLFLGSTIGNFTPHEASRFLGRVAHQMQPDDYLLLGTDLVKREASLHAAYNDAQGITAEFNKNVLCVLNRVLGANFEPEYFEHVAEFVSSRSQIEMRLRSSKRQSVHLEQLELTVDFAPNEEILTEISRKFTRPGVQSMLAAAELELVEWYLPKNEYFALSLARRASPHRDATLEARSQHA